MRLFLLASVVGGSLIVIAASACSSSASNAADGGANSLSDADLSTGDGGKKDSVTNDSGPCLASTGAAPTCAGTCAAECQVAVSTFKPDVATSISTCLDGRVDSTGTDSDCQTAATGCVDVASAAACTDDNAASFCTTFIAACPDIDDGGTDTTQQDCVSLVQGMTDDGRTALQNCVAAQGGCGTCLTELRTLTLTGTHH